MKLQTALVGIACAAVGLLAGIYLGVVCFSPIYYQIRSEFNIHARNLESRNLSSQLREYLKSRVYSLARILRPRDLQGVRFDFGPVDEKVLGGASGLKGPETESETYEIAMTKHNQKGGGTEPASPPR